MSCPVCGEVKSFHHWCDPEHLEPDEKHCEFCGFNWIEPQREEEQVEICIDQIESIPDWLDDQIKELKMLKDKYPELKRRLEELL